MFLFTTFLHASDFNSVLNPLSAKHLTFGNNTVFDLKTFETTKQKHTLLKFNDHSNTLFSLDIIYNVGDVEGNKIASNNFFLITQLYQNKPTPYSGMISNNLNCSQEFLPKEMNLKINNKNLLILLAPVGRNLQYGVCQKDNVFMWGCSTFFKTKSNLIDLKIFLPKKAKSECLAKVKNFIGGYIEL